MAYKVFSSMPSECPECHKLTNLFPHVSNSPTCPLIFTGLSITVKCLPFCPRSLFCSRALHLYSFHSSQLTSLSCLCSFPNISVLWVLITQHLAYVGLLFFLLPNFLVEKRKKSSPTYAKVEFWLPLPLFCDRAALLT